MYPFFRGGHYFYFDVLGSYVTTDLFTSHAEHMIVFVFSNTSILLPFCITVSCCVAVVWKLGIHRRSCEDRSCVIANSDLATVSKSMETTVTNIRNLRSIIHQFSRKSRLNVTYNKEQETEENGITEDIQTDGDSEVASPVKTEKKIKKLGNRAGKKNMVIAMIISIYIACLLPGICLNVYEMLCSLNGIPEKSNIRNFNERMMSAYLYMSLVFSTLLYTLNSTINPFIYHFRCNPIVPKKLTRILYDLRMKLRA